MERGKRRGFTLAETLVVSCIIAVIALAVYGVLRSGLKAWQRASQEMPEEDMCLFLDKFASDLRNSFIYGPLACAGTRERFECATLVDSARLGIRVVGKVAYAYDPVSETLRRERYDYPAVYGKTSPESSQELIGVKSLKFSYYAFLKEKNEYVWLEEWTKGDALPLAVRVEFGFDNGK